MNGSPEYASAAAFRRAVTDRLKVEANRTGRNFQRLQREFVFQRFLTLLYREKDPVWVLKGGTGLLMRLPAARVSRNIDLLGMHNPDADDAITLLRRHIEPAGNDHLTFTIGKVTEMAGKTPGLQVTITASIGGEFERFAVDVALGQPMLGDPDWIEVTPVIDVPGLATPPRIMVYPLAGQVADKVCAMYERHGDAQGESTRYRDLIDLVLIVNTGELDDTEVAIALKSEADRRGLVLPGSIISPGRSWGANYASVAASVSLPGVPLALDEALDVVGQRLNPLLNGTGE